MKTLHLIGNAHIDPVWLWRWQEGLQEVKATFRSALDLMDEHPDFTFVASSAAFYEWIEQTDPAMFDEIRARVRQGRWEPVGGWWVEPDCNLPCGEAFVRQALYGQRYFAAKLGVTARVGFNPDSFGHCAALPQLLRQSGCEAYVFLRPKPEERALPGRLFWWEGPDGSRVLAYRIPFEYQAGPDDIAEHIRRCAAERQEPLDALMAFFGVGNHGGGPTRENLACIARLAGDAALPRLELSTTARFFAAVQPHAAALPVHVGELQHHARGCYSAHSGIKRWNRRTEQLLLCCERWSSVAAALTGQPYPEDLDRAWKALLFCQFHDTLAGTCVRPAYDDAHNQLGEAQAIAERGLNRALQSVAWNVAIAPTAAAQSVVAFNPHPWAARMPVELELDALDAAAVARDDEGREVPVQAVRSWAQLVKPRGRGCFVADLPALGYRLYRIAPAARSAGAAPAIDAGERWIESDALRLELDAETGCPAQLTSRRTGRALLAAPASAVVLDDPGDTWGHEIDAYRDAIGGFRASRIQLLELGPVRAVLRSEARFERSTLVQEFALYRGLELVFVTVQLDWHEARKVLKLRFPLALVAPRATFEVPYGHVIRPADGTEEPALSWVDVSGDHALDRQPCGLSLLNDAKYAFDVSDATLGMTLARSPIYAHHDPCRPTADEVALCEHIDQGCQALRYALLPHRGSWRVAATPRRAAELNLPAFAVPGTPHRGPLPASRAAIAFEGAGVLITALKRSEDGEDLILRCQEIHGAPCTAQIALPPWRRELTLALRPYEIATLRIPRAPTAPPLRVDLLERPLPAGAAATP